MSELSGTRAGECSASMRASQWGHACEDGTGIQGARGISAELHWDGGRRGDRWSEGTDGILRARQGQGQGGMW